MLTFCAPTGWTNIGPSFFISTNLCIENIRTQTGDVHLCIWRRITIAQAASEAEAALVKDSNGNVLQDGDTVVIIKDLKVKGATSALKKGTKVKNIRLVDDGIHNIDCNIPGFGAMSLKSEFVKKA